MDLIDEQSSTEISSRIQYEIRQNGAFKIVCLNLETRNRIIRLIKRFRIPRINSGLEFPFFVIPENDTIKHLIMSCVVDEPITSEQFLTSVASKNSFHTSRWLCEDSQPHESGGHKVNFAVDPITFRYMLTDDLTLYVKDQDVQAKLELNPFLAYMFEEC